MSLPTASEFKARHPRFAAILDATVDLYLAEAGAIVSEDAWAPGDYAPGVFYMAAHLMVEEGALDPTGPAQGVTGALKKAKAGEVEVAYDAQPRPLSTGGRVTQSSATYGGTVYGRRYLELASRNGGVVGAAVMIV